ncbi:MAG: hypothetical protein WC108_05020 [Bacteroidales bacterium]|jgi:hypothetical protein|nr:hypothetical protein [Bacteroidales bacterium]MDD4528262.1 hypothetical protein [Bacteroidales bacterium]MDD4830105.1 hypothetical protein [Bacteroidales bacterium]
MNIIRISKLLDILSYLGIVAIIGYYIFSKPSSETLLIGLLLVSIIRMVGSNLRANYYQKHYNKLKEDHEFLQRGFNELSNKEKKDINN